MCGINGFNFKDLNLLIKMSKLTSSRGPDNEGFFLNDNYSVAHNRLSIIDIEKRSNQPFKFENLVISFNGEIYNYLDLSDKLKNGILAKDFPEALPVGFRGPNHLVTSGSFLGPQPASGNTVNDKNTI